MVSKRILPLVLAGLFLFSGQVFAQAENVLLGNSSTSTSSTSSTSNDATQDEKDRVQDAVCDPKVFARMKQKAWMEAQRENYVTQSLVLKPDSLFAITCFDKQLGQVMGKMGVKEKGETSKATRFQAAVANGPGKIYTQFMGTMDGGKPLLTPNKNSSENTVYSDYDAVPKENTGDFSCDQMNKLWQQSQCGNFNAGDLPSLKEAGSTKDARKYPAACTAGKDDVASGNADYTNAKASADIYAPGSNLPNYSKVNLYLCKTSPFSQLADLKCTQQSGQSDLCWPGEPSGVNTAKGAQSVSCSNPGCSAQLDGSAYKCKKTQ